MNTVIYTENNLKSYYFSSACDVYYTPGRITIEPTDRPDRMTIAGDDFVVKKLYENLLCGVEEPVLAALLAMLPEQDLLRRLEEGKYIE